MHKCDKIFPPDTYAKNKDGEVWVWQFREDLENISGVSDEENQENGIFIIMFATTRNLTHLGRADIWYGDGTFSVHPNIFYQLYTIHAEVHGKIVPVVYSLLSSKSKQFYKFMWSQLKDLMIQKGINPS